MKNKSLLTFFIVLLQVGSSAYALQPDSAGTDSLSLSQAVSKALNNNHNIIVARNNAAIDENNATLGNAGLLPSLSANGSYNRSIEDTRQSFIGDSADQVTEGSTSSSYNASLDMQYTLFDGFGNQYRLQSLRSLEELGSVESRLQIETTLLQVIRRYLEVIANKRLETINREALEVSNERYERARRQYEMGGRTKVNLLNAQVALNQDSVRYIQSQANLKKAKHNLLVLLGEQPSGELSVRSAFQIDRDLNLQNLVQASLNNNASLVSSELQAEQARLSLKQARSERYPRLDAQASYSYTRSESDASFLQFQEVDGFSYGLTLSFNIFNGFRRTIDIQNAEIRLENSRELREFASKELRKNVRNVYEDYSSNLFLLKKQDLNVQTAELNFERTRQAFELGQVSNTEFREAQLNLLRARQELISLKVNAKLSEVELLQLAGKLIEQNS